MITVEEARARVEAIRAIAGDDESAHAAEDALRHEVLQAIMNGADNARALAAVACSTEAIQFCRWCA